MPDLSQYSDEELEAIAAGEMPRVNADVSKSESRSKALEARPAKVRTIRDMSDAELEAIAKAPEPEEPGVLEEAGQSALRGLVKIGQAVDSVTGAPTRAAVFKLQDGGSFLDSIGEFAEQFAGDPTKAPTGEDIAIKAGIDPEDKVQFTLGAGGPSEVPVEIPAGKFYGFLLDVALDPTNLIPGVGAARATAKGASRAAKVTARGAGRGIAAATRKTAPKVADAGVAIREQARGVAESMQRFLDPKRAPDYDELVDIARRNKIDVDRLEPVEFPQGSLIQRADLAARSSLDDKAAEAFRETLDQVREAVRQNIRNIGGGKVPGPVEAGEFLRNAYDRGFDRVFGSLEETYNKVIKDFPGLKISTRAVASQKSPAAKLESALKGIERFAKGRLNRGVTDEFRGQARDLLKSVKAIRSTNGSVKQAVEALRDIGEAAFKKQNKFARTPPDIGKMRKLYGDLSEAIKQTIRQDVKDGPSIVKQLELDNAKISKFFTDRAPLERLLGDPGKSPEAIFRGLVSAGDTNTIRSLKELLSPQDLQVVKAAAVNTLLRGEDFSFARLGNKLRDKAFLYRELLTPQEFAGLADVIRLGEAFGPAQLTAPAAGVSGILRDIGGATRDSLLNDAVINMLKARARGRALQTPAAAAPIPAVNQSTRIRIPRRRRIDDILKGTQVISTQQREEDR